jgi:hypothetical protein
MDVLQLIGQTLIIVGSVILLFFAIIIFMIRKSIWNAIVVSRKVWKRIGAEMRAERLENKKPKP